MSSNFNDMERMFADGLQNYEVTPPAHVWGNIQKRKRKGLVFYKWRIASAILLLCIAGTSAYYFINENNEKTNNPVIAQTSNNDDADLKSQTDKNQIISEKGDLENTSKINISSSKASNNTGKFKKAIKPNYSKSFSRPEIVNDDLNIENTNYNTEVLLFNIASKRKIKLRYIMYPSLTQFVYSTKKIAVKKYLAPKQDDEKDAIGSKFSIEIGGGPSFASRKLSGNGSLLRNESETATLGVLTMFKVNYHFNTKWSLQSGLTLENRNEKIKYNQTEIKDKLTETTHQVTVFHPVLPPKTITVIDSTYTKENVDYSFNTTNKYQTLNIPMVLGYNFTLGKLQYRLSAGSLFNIYSMNNAYNLVRNNDKIELAPYKESTKIKTSVYGALALLYPLGTQYSGIVEVSYYNNLANRLNSDAVINQRNYGFNLSTGIKINLIK